MTNNPSDNFHYSEMKAELQALRKKLEDLETKQAAFKSSTHPMLRRRFSTSVIVALIPLAALLAAGGLLWGQGAIEALYVDPNGNVGIGTTSPTVRLDVAGAPRIGSISPTARALYVTGDFDAASKGVEFRNTNGTQGIGFGYNSIYATGTNANQDLNLIPRGTGNVGIGTQSPAAPLDIGGSVAGKTQAIFTRGADNNFQLVARNGDGGNSPGAEVARFGVQYSGNGWNSGFRFLRGGNGLDGEIAVDSDKNERLRISNRGLDVKGEIRGKPWFTGPFEWRKGEGPKHMTRTDRSVCFLTLVSGYFYGGGEVVEIAPGTDGRWWLQGQATQRDVRAKAMCIGAPDDSW